MYRLHTLPTKPTKDPTEEESGGRPARSIEQSLVLLQALRQSRQTWLTSAFVKFSTKSRGGKGSEVWQPPHTIRFRGKCDLEIGPHVFYSTSVYEVTYQPYQVPVQTPSPYYAPSGQTFSGWPAGPYTYASAPQASSTSSTTAAQVYAPSTTALVSSLKGAVPITNDLISHVNTAAVTNPTLANLLSLAASGSATPAQLQTLGVTIQSLAESAPKRTSSSTPPQTGPPASSPPSKAAQTSQSQTPIPPPKFQPPSSTKASASTSTASQAPVLSLRPSQTTPSKPTSGASTSQPPIPQQLFQPSQMQTISKDPDVVIEFYENAYDRWVLPKELVLYERVKRWEGNNSLADIIFSTICPFEGFQPPSTTVGQTPSLSAGSATEVPQPNKDMVHPITLRFFNVPAAIWNMFSKSAGDEERTKRVRAAMDVQLDKAASRTYLQHRIAEGGLLTQLQASMTDRYLTKPIRPTTTTGQTQAKRRAPATTKNGKEGSPAGAPPPKRRKAIPVKKPEPVKGKCEGCLRGPVNLVPETSFCPTCDKAKNAKLSFTPAAGSTPPQTSTVSVASRPAAQSPMQTSYGSRLPVQNYYAWQNQPQYVYQYQPQPQGQPQHPSSQSAAPAGANQPSPSQPPAQPPVQPPAQSAPLQQSTSLQRTPAPSQTTQKQPIQGTSTKET